MSLDKTLHTRRAALRCLAFGSAGTLFTLAGGVFTPVELAQARNAPLPGKPLFVQISDTHIGFNKDANPDVGDTLTRSIALVNALPQRPSLVIHTGDITHLSKPAEFDLAQQLLSQLRGTELHTVPGEHDVSDATVSEYFTRFGQPSGSRGYYSFDHQGVHFVALVNVLQFKPGVSGRSAPSSSRGSRTISRDAVPAPRSWCSPTCRCGRSMNPGAGAPAMRRS
jgi:predicted MPP superfamily phosphohydrolase